MKQISNSVFIAGEWLRPEAGTSADKWISVLRTQKKAVCPVYLLKLCQHTPGESLSNIAQELHSHWVVLVDIDRKTSEKDVIGLELHLLLKEAKSNALVVGPARLGTFQKSRLLSWKQVGITENLGRPTPGIQSKLLIFF